MNSTPQEKLILRKFCKHLNSNVFEVCVHQLFAGRIVWVSIRYLQEKEWKQVFWSEYSSQQEVLDKAEEVCMMVLFGVSQ